MANTSLRIVPALAALAAAAALSVPAADATAPAASAVRTCRVVAVVDQGKRYGYSIRIDRGSITCLRARSVMHTFLARDVSPRGWFCVRGHASQHQKWAAQCANEAGAAIKAFGPLKG
jgi:hypothetical protein